MEPLVRLLCFQHVLACELSGVCLLAVRFSVCARCPIYSAQQFSLLVDVNTCSWYWYICSLLLVGKTYNLLSRTPHVLCGLIDDIWPTSREVGLKVMDCTGGATMPYRRTCPDSLPGLASHSHLPTYRKCTLHYLPGDEVIGSHQPQWAPQTASLLVMVSGVATLASQALASNSELQCTWV